MGLYLGIDFSVVIQNCLLEKIDDTTYILGNIKLPLQETKILLFVTVMIVDRSLVIITFLLI